MIVRRLFSAVKEGRLSSGLKRRIKPTLIRFARAAMLRPVLRRAALICLWFVPGIKLRLRNLMSPKFDSAKASEALSPATQLIYRRLQRAQQDQRYS